ncbi:MAG: glycosyltransferase [Methanobacterium sp.]|nr:glycosyltransferase [Methanobacterium sp.]
MRNPGETDHGPAGAVSALPAAPTHAFRCRRTCRPPGRRRTSAPSPVTCGINLSPVKMDVTDMTTPKSLLRVSVIIPAYNCENTVETAIRSALGQTVRDIELIVVDDGSRDRTRPIVTSLAAADPRIKFIPLAYNVGVSAARNIALANAAGNWVAMLDADDWFRPDRLENLLAAAERLDADLVCDNLRLFDHALGRVVGGTHFGARHAATPMTVRQLFDLDHAFRRHHLGFTKPMIKTAFLKDKNISYDCRLRVGEDFLFLAEIILNGANAFILPTAGYVYVHRIAPSTRAVAPNSRAGTGFADICRSCHYLLGKYWKKMNKEERRSLSRKRKSVTDWMAYREALTAFHAKDFRKMIDITRRHPMVAVVKFFTVRNRIHDLLMIRWSRIKMLFGLSA